MIITHKKYVGNFGGEGGIRPAALGQCRRQPGELKNHSLDGFFPPQAGRSLLIPPSFMQHEKETANAISFSWKRNHILIEFLPMGANARLLVQIDTYGCKSRGAVARHPILRKDSAVYTI